jgi:hypothetical protein
MPPFLAGQFAEYHTPPLVDLSVRPPFPRVIDNSMRVLFVSCPEKWKLRYGHGLALRDESIDLHAGGVFARGLEVARWKLYDDGFSVDQALVAAFPVMVKAWGNFDSGDSVKSFYRCVTALEFYFNEAYQPAVDTIQPLRLNGKPCIEWNFVLPIDVKNPETGEPILYAGRFDMFGTLNNEKLVIVDEKTTKQLGGQWASKWRLRSQFTGYAWGAQQFGHHVDAAVIRGISFLKYHHETLQSIVYRPAWHIDMWYEQLIRDVNRLVRCWEDNKFDRNLADECGAYGGCMFADLCDTNDPQSWVSQYVVSRWDPLKRIEERQDV